MSLDPTRIDIATDPQKRRMTGVTAHGYIPFNVPYMSEIAPNLWQGGCAYGLVLPDHIDHLVSLYSGERYAVHHRLSTHLAVQMLDSTDEDMGLIDDIARWVNACRETGPCAIHCQAGLNRSSLVTARALMLGGMTAADAVSLLREKRSPACLCNPAFLEWLLAQDTRASGSADDGLTRVYARRGRMAHLLRPGSSPNTGYPMTLCQRQTPLGQSWHGTGSQYEHDRAALLPLCQRCEAATKTAAGRAA